MKSKYSVGFAIAVLTASVLLINTPSLSAQDANRPRPGGGQGGQPGQRGGGFGAMQDMTDEQRAALRQIGEETRDLGRQLAEARTALNDAIYAEKVSEEQIKQKAAALAKVEAEYSVARAKAFSKVRSKFSSEQIEAMKRMGGMGGFGAGPGGGRQRGGQ